MLRCKWCEWVGEDRHAGEHVNRSTGGLCICTQFDPVPPAYEELSIPQQEPAQKIKWREFL